MLKIIGLIGDAVDSIIDWIGITNVIAIVLVTGFTTMLLAPIIAGLLAAK